MSAPTQLDWQSVIRCVKYGFHTRGLVFKLQPNIESLELFRTTGDLKKTVEDVFVPSRMPHLEVYSDSNWADSSADYRST